MNASQQILVYSVWMSTKQLNLRLAGGEDGIVPEILKRCNIDDIVLENCNRDLENGPIPESWKISIIIPIAKKKDLTDPNNQRGIAITSQVSKTLNRMILNRLKPKVEKLLRGNQNGFRNGRSTGFSFGFNGLQEGI